MMKGKNRMQAGSGPAVKFHPSWMQSFELNPGDGGSSFFRNASIYIQDHLKSQARRQSTFLPLYLISNPKLLFSSFIRRMLECYLITVSRLLSPYTPKLAVPNCPKFLFRNYIITYSDTKFLEERKYQNKILDHYSSKHSEYEDDLVGKIFLFSFLWQE
jgi:hypothetical protein